MRSPASELGEVNVVSANLDDPTDLTLYSGPILSSRPGEACWTALLSAPAIPAVGALTGRLTDDNVIASFTFR